MTSRQLITLCVLTTMLVGGGLLVAMLSVRPAPVRDVSSTNPLKGHPDAVDRLAMFDSADRFRDGALEHVVIAGQSPARIVLADKSTNTYPRYGSWTSPEVTTEFGFTELIPSWNAQCPPNTGVRFDVRTRDARSGEWTPWLYVGQWGRTLGNRSRVTTCEWGIVHIDNLVLDRPADAYQVRATLESFDLDPGLNPSIRRIAISYTGVVNDSERRDRLAPPVKVLGNWQRDLGVPFFAQGVAPSNVRGSICSPTSVTMVMSYWGVNRSVLENALAIYDEEADLFGNWGRAVQRAGELGLDAWVTRFRNWEQVKAMIAQGQPVVAAINFRKGQFPTALYDDTNGHLIVIRGFTPAGDVIVNDPASREKGNGVIYPLEPLGVAWFTNAGGVAYVIRRPQGSAVADSGTTDALPPSVAPATAPATVPATVPAASIW